MQMLDLGPAVLAVDEVVDHAGLERPGPEQGDQRDEVVEAVGLQSPDEILHPARLELEHRGRRAGAHELVGGRIVGGECLEVERVLAGRTALIVDGGQRPVDDGERAQAEKVELHQPDGFDVVLVELGDRALRTGLAVQCGELGQALRGNHDPAGVPARVSRQPFEPARQIDDRPDVVVRLVALLQCGVGERAVKRHPELERDQLRDLIDEPVGVAEHAADVAYHRLGGHGPERDDLGHVVRRVPGGDVVDDAIASLHAEIDVEVRQRHPFRVEKPLEQQVVVDRVEIGDSECVCDERSGPRTASRPHRYALLPAPTG